MIWGPIAAAVRCMRRARRVAAPPAEPPKLTMEQVAVLLRPRSPVVRRLATGGGCAATVLPTAAIPPALPALPPAAPPPTPLPFGIGTGDLLPTAFGAPPWSPPAPIYDTIAQAPAGVPEPSTLAVLLVAVAILGLATLTRILIWRSA